MTDPRLDVRTIATSLVTPTTIAFLGEGDFLVLEKNTGRVMRVVDGVVQGPVLDLAVNFASERGLLGIALHPDFPSNPRVYLFWTCRTAAASVDPFVPDVEVCPDAPSTGDDTDVISAVPLLGNRVDRFLWNGSTLAWDQNLIHLRSFQADAAPTPPDQGDADQPSRGNHNGGIIRFGPDGKLYIIFGDQGRRGQLQNLPSGPTETGLGPVVDDDQFGGPEPDDAHLSGVILRLNDDGSTPTDNPFFAAGAEIGGEVGANIQKIFAYGIRNSFGMAFDPRSGKLWYQDNGEDAYDEINIAEAGLNSGWIQFAGPAERVGDFRQIEMTSLHNEAFPNLQQLRWGPERIAPTTEEAFSRLFELPGSHYSDPEFSWKHVLAPAGIGFLSSRELGSQFAGDLFVGFSVPSFLGGPLFHFRLNGGQGRLHLSGSGLKDRVADNLEPGDLTESEDLVIGRDFGIVTDIGTTPEGTLYVVSLDQGAVHEVFAVDKGGNPNQDAARIRLAPGSERTFLAGGKGVGAPAAQVEFELDSPEVIDAEVYNVQGRLVRSLVRGQEFSAGTNAVSWDGRGEEGAAAPAGMYYMRLKAGPSAVVARVLWMR